MSNVFKTKLSTASLVLIPACIGINYLGKLFASVLKLPLWLDAIGTCIGGALGGPVIGAICGAANNLIYGFTTGDSITLVYGKTWQNGEVLRRIFNCNRGRLRGSAHLHTAKLHLLGRYNRKRMGRCCICSNTGSRNASGSRFLLRRSDRGYSG